MSKKKSESHTGKNSILTRYKHGPWPQDPKYDRNRLLWCIILLILSTLIIEAISIFWTAGRYSGLLITFISAPLVIILNLLPLALLVAIFYSLTGRVGLSIGIPRVILLILTLINSFKLNLRGDPFVFSDIFLAGEAGEMMAGSYTLVFSESQIIGLIITILGLIFLNLVSGKIRLKGHWIARGCTAGGCAAVLVILILFVYPNNSLYKSTYAGGDLVSSRNAAQWYAAHGFTWSFLHSAVDEEDVSDLFSFVDSSKETEETDTIEETEEESEETDIIEEAEEESEETDIVEETEEEIEEYTVLPNIIAIQLEAYCDVTDYFDTEAVESVYSAIHEIEENSISGNLLVNHNGGGTSDTERAVITGYITLPDFSTTTNSYAWYLQSLGYTVEGSHPNTGTFYDRETINFNLGFENYYFTENYYDSLIDSDTASLESDAILFQEILNLMEADDSGNPYFSLNVSIQNHGPYKNDGLNGLEYLTEEDCANETVRNIVNNYLDLISTTNDALVDMVEELSSMDEPVVLVVFGDHMPYWGNYTTLDPYAELGINDDASTDEGFYNYYSVPYFIWANDAAKEALGEDFIGDGGDFGPYFLMNKVFELCGITGDEMMEASNTLLDAGITMVSSAVELYCEDGQLVETLSEEGQKALDTFLEFQDSWQNNFQYEEQYEEMILEDTEEETEESVTTEETEEGSTPEEDNSTTEEFEEVQETE